jgi:transcriptional regulator with XRE-family HTH domain
MSLVFRKIALFLPSLRHHEGPGFVTGSMKLKPDRFCKHFFSEEVKTDIRERYANGEKQTVLAKEYGVSQMYICNLCRGKKRIKGRRMKGKDEKAEIMKERSEGMKLKEIAAKHDMTPQGVSYICKGDKERKSWRRLNEEETKEMMGKFANGSTQHELAIEFKVSRGTVSRKCKGVVRKVVPKRKRKASEMRIQRIQQDFKDGMTQTAIARKNRLSVSTIANYCEGIESTKGRKRRQSLNDDEKAEARVKFAQGKSIRELAEEYNVSKSQMVKVCKGVERTEFPKFARKPLLSVH